MRRYKQMLLSIFALLTCLHGANAQTTLRGLWEFDDPANPAKATIGKDLIFEGEPPRFGPRVEDDEGNILGGVIQTPAPAQANRIRCVHDISPNGGGKYVNQYSIVVDMFSPKSSRNEWRSIYQTNENNGNEGDYFINRGNDTLGVKDVGYTKKGIDETKWSRLILTIDLPARGGDVTAYIDGKLHHTHPYDLGVDSRFSLGKTLLFFADNSGENALLNVGAVAIFEGVLSPEQVIALGNPSTKITNVKNPAKPQLTVATAQELLTGHWIPNLEQTEARHGELDPSQREVYSILGFDFTSNSISLSVNDEPVTISINQEIVTPNERFVLKKTKQAHAYQLILTDEKGVEHLDEVQFISEDRISVTLGKQDNGHPVVLDRKGKGNQASVAATNNPSNQQPNVLDKLGIVVGEFAAGKSELEKAMQILIAAVEAEEIAEEAASDLAQLLEYLATIEKAKVVAEWKKYEPRFRKFVNDQ